jgi:uncharacterized membrane protein
MLNGMKTESRLISLALSLSLVTMFFLSSVLCLGQLQWHISIQVEILSDGSATWVVQQRTMLVTQDDEAAFFQYLNITSVDAISSHVHSMVDQASLTTGRSMRVENLEVTANVSTQGLSSVGIIQYQFDWVGFAETTGDGEIMVGDAFSGDLDLLRDDELTIKYPSDRSSVFVYPQPDQVRESENTLTWFGPRNFGAGEPIGLFERRSSSWADLITGNTILLIAVVFAVSAGLVGYFFGLKRARLIGEPKSHVVEDQASLSELSVEDDEERVVRLLVAAGGRMQQLAIARQCGFSKSKASEVLSAMESKGMITRKKLGRGKIVTLAEKPKT